MNALSLAMGLNIGNMFNIHHGAYSCSIVEFLICFVISLFIVALIWIFAPFLLYFLDKIIEKLGGKY